MDEKDKSFGMNNLPELGDLLGDCPTTSEGAADDFRIPNPADSLVNVTIGTYKILSLIGEGGFGKVYKAHDAALGRDVAIKFLWGAPDASRRILFEREARAIAALSKHPNIVAIHHWGEYEGRSYIVLEYVASSVPRLLEEHPEGLPVPMALRIALDCASGLEEAHRHNILHRDIKPANILLEPESGQAKLTDFGLARLGSPSEFTIEGRISGSPAYMSPEQANAETLDERSDIFSLGVTLYELLSRKRPFEGVTTDEIIGRLRRNERVLLKDRRPDLPKPICDLVEKTMAFKAEDRFDNAGELARQLRFALQSLERRGVVALDETGSLGAQDQAGAATGLKLLKRGILAAGITAAVLYSLLVLLPGKSEHAGNNGILQAAVASINEADFAKAAEAFKEALNGNPDHDQARYGYCIALANLGRIQEATETAQAIGNPELRADAEGAIAFLSQPGEARARIAAMTEKSPTAYLRSLLAKLDVVDGNYAQAAGLLDNVSEDQFPFAFQYSDALGALGQACYHLGQYGDATAAFEKVARNAPAPTQKAAQAYLAEIATQRDETRREEIRAKAAEIRNLMNQSDIPVQNVDEWTSRPLTFAVLPGEVKRGRLAVESGLADLLPALMGNQLTTNTPMKMVDRELLRELLAEQELSGTLSTNEGRLRLGRVLGARLLIKCDFTLAGSAEKALVTVDDVETTERIPVPVQEITAPVSVDAVSDAIARVVSDSIREHYPVQGRLQSGTDGPEINIGSAAGVVPGMTFDILSDPETPPIAGAKAVVSDAPGSTSAKVTVSGVDVAAGTAWLVRAQRGGAV